MSNIAGMKYVQEINILVQPFITGIYMYNLGHSATYKYKGTTQYKIRLQPKIQIKSSRSDEAGKPKTRREYSPNL